MKLRHIDEKFFSVGSDFQGKFTFNEESEHDQKLLADARASILQLGQLCFSKCVNPSKPGFPYHEQICIQNCVRGSTQNLKLMIQQAQTLPT